MELTLVKCGDSLGQQDYMSQAQYLQHKKEMVEVIKKTLTEEVKKSELNIVHVREQYHSPNMFIFFAEYLGKSLADV